jgi:hypothetical protein
MKRLFTVALTMLSALVMSAQNYYVSGKVTDSQTGETLIGANVLYSETQGTVSDFDGKYSIELPNGTYTFRVSYVGYDLIEKQIVVANKSQTINFSLQSKTLDEVVVNADWAQARETPVAFTNVLPAQINNELAGQDLPMVLNSTPGIYATQQGGGDGDARINIRGFPQNYVAVMIDGIPVNDMENGWVYWSNWFGLDAITRSMQVQRGLGVSKLAIPSVGGTINIITKGIETKREATIKQYVDINGKLQTTLGYTSGMLENGWGFTAAGSYKKGNTWIQETNTEGWFYYFKVDKRWKKHVTSLTGFGAPQEHDQRLYKRSVAAYSLDYARKVGIDVDAVDEDGDYLYRPSINNKGFDYNYQWGYITRDRNDENANKEVQNERINMYHKPQFSLRDTWNPTDKIYISNTIYTSIGRGGGTSLRYSLKNTQLVQDPIAEDYGQINFQSIYGGNSKPTNSPFGLTYPIDTNYSHTEYVSSNFLVKKNNEHIWYGYLSNIDYNYNDYITISGGIDLRTYKGTHYMSVYDLLGGDYAIDLADTRMTNSTQAMKRVGDKVYYYDNGYVRYGGLFGQVQYKTSIITTFLNLSYAHSQIKKEDFFAQSTSDWKGVNSYTFKGGFNYNATEHSNVFINLGYMSKIRDFDSYYYLYSTDFIDDVENERVKAIELGYNFHSTQFSASVNTYFTRWENKDVGSYSTKIDDEAVSGNIPGMDAKHMGVELDFAYEITPKLEIQGLLSLGDWIWDSKVENLYLYNQTDKITPVDTVNFDARGIHVGDAAQTQLGANIKYEPFKGMYIIARTTYFARYFSDFSPEDCTDDYGNPIDPWSIPNYNLVDLHIGYNFHFIKKPQVKYSIRGSITNLLNTEYISDATNNSTYIQKTFTDNDAKSAEVFFGSPRRYVLTLEIKF